MHRSLVRRLETSSLLEHAPVEIDGDDVAIARELDRLLVGALALDENAIAVRNARAHVPERAARQSLIADDAAGERDGLAQLDDHSRLAHPTGNPRRRPDYIPAMEYGKRLTTDRDANGLGRRRVGRLHCGGSAGGAGPLL